ncbi:MAG TPA: putative manganese transporter [Tissierellaceae bacterium]
MNEVLQIIIKSAESAFIEVTVFVGAVLMIFGYINFLKSGKLVRKIESSKKKQPVIGALLGLTPGCGGAIFVMPLFPKGTISFGTVVATLIATMGDSAFVLLSVMPFDYILVSIISFIVAIIVGYIVDYFKIGSNLQTDIIKRNEKDYLEKTLNKDHSSKDHSTQIHELEDSNLDLMHIGHDEGDYIDEILHHEIKGYQDHKTIGYKVTHTAYPIYWIFIFVGLILGILDLFQVDINNLIVPNLGTIIGVSGTFLSIFTMIMSKKFIQSDTHEETELKAFSLKETIIHNAQETAFVATWVFFAYLAYEFFILFGLGKGDYILGESILTNFLTQTGLMAVIIGALIGIIPGCGPQIIFVTLYTKGLIPFSALLANAISQDGDALFPLIAIDKKSALLATVLNTIPALIVGMLFYFLEYLLL